MKNVTKIGIFGIICILLLNNCQKSPRKDTEIDQAIEIVCPGAPPTLILRISKEEAREALRKKYSHNKTRDTVLKLPNGSNVMIPTIRPRDLDKCIVRSIPKIVIPISLGY